MAPIYWYHQKLVISISDLLPLSCHHDVDPFFSKLSSLCAIICIIPSIFSAISCICNSCFKNLGVLKYVVCLCRGCDVCCVFHLRIYLIILDVTFSVSIGTSSGTFPHSRTPLFPTQPNKPTSAPSSLKTIFPESAKPFQSTPPMLHSQDAVTSPPASSLN